MRVCARDRAQETVKLPRSFCAQSLRFCSKAGVISKSPPETGELNLSKRFVPFISVVECKHKSRCLPPITISYVTAFHETTCHQNATDSEFLIVPFQFMLCFVVRDYS